jgi:hypothetical protein
MIEAERVKVGEYAAIIRYPSGRSDILGYGQTCEEAHGLVDEDMRKHIAATLNYTHGQSPEWFVAKVSSVSRVEIPPTITHKSEADDSKPDNQKERLK